MNSWFYSSNPLKKVVGKIASYPASMVMNTKLNLFSRTFFASVQSENLELFRVQSQIGQFTLTEEEDSMRNLMNELGNIAKSKFLLNLRRLLRKCRSRNGLCKEFNFNLDTDFISKFLTILYNLRDNSNSPIGLDTAIEFHDLVLRLPEYAGLIALLCSKVQVWEKFICRRPNITDGKDITEHLLGLCFDNFILQQESSPVEEEDNIENSEKRSQQLNNIRLIGEFINKKLLTCQDMIGYLVTMLRNRADNGDTVAIEQVCLLLKILQENQQKQRASSHPVDSFTEIIGIKAVIRLKRMLLRISDDHRLPTSIKKTVQDTLRFFSNLDN